MFDAIFGIEAQRRRLYRKAADSPLKDYLSVPFPELTTPIIDVPLLALDFETTGLDPNKDQILSIGYVCIDHLEIKLASCGHYIVNTLGQLQHDNVIIHQITDDEKGQGISLASAMESLLSVMAGRVVLVHFKRIEQLFLQKSCVKLYGHAPKVPMLDTLLVAKKRLDKSPVPYDPSKLRLSNLREFHQLPGHYAHNALNDAIATAELLCAELLQLKEGYQTPLKKLLS